MVSDMLRSSGLELKTDCMNWRTNMLLGTIYSMRPLQDQSALPGQKTNQKNINGEHYVARHIPQRSAQTHSDRVHTEKSFQNSQTFHKPLQYSTEKLHKGTQLFRTSGKGAQPLMLLMANRLLSVKTDWKCIVCDFAQQNYFLLNYCLMLGNAVP